MFRPTKRLRVQLRASSLSKGVHWLWIAVPAALVLIAFGVIFSALPLVLSHAYRADANYHRLTQRSSWGLPSLLPITFCWLIRPVCWKAAMGDARGLRAHWMLRPPPWQFSFR